MSTATLGIGMRVISEKLESSRLAKKEKAPAISEAKLLERSRDAKLVAQAKKGNNDAFRDLVELYQGRIHSVALGLVGNHQDAEDLTQHAFLKAYKNIKAFRGQSGFYTWIYRILVNLSIDSSRRAYRKAEIGIDNQATMDALSNGGSVDPNRYSGTVDGPDKSYQRSEMRQRFKQALSELSPEHRTVLVLREVDGCSYDEMSEVIGCTKGTVMSRLHHARKKMQILLADLMEENAGVISNG